MGSNYFEKKVPFSNYFEKRVHHRRLGMLLVGFCTPHAQSENTSLAELLRGVPEAHHMPQSTGDLRPLLKGETLKKWSRDIFENRPGTHFENSLKNGVSPVFCMFKHIANL